jgi:hypothetical protein
MTVRVHYCASLAVLLMGCGGSEPSPIAPDATGPDAAISCVDQCLAPDAGSDGASGSDGGPDATGGGRPLHAECDILEDQCASGLTCRSVGGPMPFRCEPIGPLGEGVVCQSSEQCGHAMGCWSTPTDRQCFITCDTANPSRRCSAGQQCLPLNLRPYPANAGLCS